jgi:transcriptional regulator with XRE-family HTH domain
MTTQATYLRTLRQKWALTQKELGILIGVSEDSISKYECNQRYPGRNAIMAIEVVFGKPARAVFPRLHAGIEEIVMARATIIDRNTTGRTDKDSLKKQQLLAGMTGRAGSRPSIYGESA